MSPRKKTTKSKISFFIVLLFFFFENCRTAPKNSDFDYHDTDFKCISTTGWRDQERFSKYLEIWEKIRQGYRSQNQNLKSANAVIVGNSLIHLFPESIIDQNFSKGKVVLRGIGGDMSDLILKRIDDNVLNLNPKIIIIEIGGNDLIFGKCLSYLESNILKLVETIQAKNKDIKIIFISVPPTLTKELNAISPVFNSFLSDLARDNQNILFIDLWAKLREEDRPIIKKEFSLIGTKDKVHFNEKAYAILVQLLKPYLSE